MAYTFKPGDPPALDMGAITKKLTAGEPLTAKQAEQWIAWKQWVESTNKYEGADKGGIRDVLDADAKAVDGLKRDLDNYKENTGVELNSVDRRLDALEAASVTTPFPGSG